MVFLQLLVGVSVMANAVIYGIDICAGVIMRPVYAGVDDATMTVMAGRGHHYGDKRLPVVGITGFVTAIAATIGNLITGHIPAAVFGAVAVIALTLWLVLYARGAKPINSRQKEAALSGVIPADARQLQNRWDAMVPTRITLQTVALAALIGALAI
ncbi:DUF1772 domain-containing protein [Gordonia sp. DT219]|uniref:DUF1772 domain-containing protein n=1 Tax=Gordonia sp. DT219 TaxID=3416658 RepID=UPI003CF7E0F0